MDIGLVQQFAAIPQLDDMIAIKPLPACSIRCLACRVLALAPALGDDLPHEPLPWRRAVECNDDLGTSAAYVRRWSDRAGVASCNAGWSDLDEGHWGLAHPNAVLLQCRNTSL